MKLTEKTAIEMVGAGSTVSEVAEKLGYTYGGAYMFLKKCGLKAHRKARAEQTTYVFKDPLHQEKMANRKQVIIALFNEGKTLEEIGQLHSITRERVRQIVGKAGLTPRRETARSVDAQKVAALAAMVEQGLTLNEIKEKSDLSPAYITKALKKHAIKYNKMGPAAYRKRHEIEVAIEKVMSGETIRHACNAEHSLECLVADELKRRGLHSRHHRWGGTSQYRAIEEKARLFCQEPHTHAELAKHLGYSNAYNIALRLGLVMVKGKVGPRESKVVLVPEAPKPPKLPRPPKIIPHADKPFDASAFHCNLREKCWIGHEQGYSAREIAAGLQITRNSVIGFWFRKRRELEQATS